MKIYFAAPLFSQAEQTFNQTVVNQLRIENPSFDIFLPQEQGINDKSTFADSIKIAQTDTEAVLKADCLIAVLDGLVIDPGVAAEIGIAYANKIPVIGFLSDPRIQGATNSDKLAALKQVAESQFPYLNLYVVGLIKMNGMVVTNVTDLTSALQSLSFKFQND